MQLHISENIDQLSKTVADWLVQYIEEVLQKQDRFTIALSGGSTPQKLFELLATDAYKNKIAWSKLHVFWGDERYVPFNDDRNNAKMAYTSLLNHVPVPASQIHVMQTENISPEDSANQYEQILHKYFDNASLTTHPSSLTPHPSPLTAHYPSTFDLILLGMGDDGHTLSLFPRKAVIHETKRWVTAFYLDEQKMHRITLTHPVANNAARIIFLASGSKKAKALVEVLKGGYNPDLYPSQIIKPVNGELHWFIDEAAAAKL